MKDQEWQYGEGNEYLSLDFSRCQRPDGTYYGTGGVCAEKAFMAPPKEKEPRQGTQARRLGNAREDERQATCHSDGSQGT